MILLKLKFIYVDNNNTMVNNFFVNPFDKKKNKNSVQPTYIKKDGTKVIEQKTDFGFTVFELSPDCTLISRFYDNNNKLISDIAKNVLMEIGHQYDEDGRTISEFCNFYDKTGVLKQKTEKSFSYHDNGQTSSEIEIIFPGDIKTVINFDEDGKRIEKYIQRGTVKTWYDINEKPFKREIDRGSGGIITEDL